MTASIERVCSGVDRLRLLMVNVDSLSDPSKPSTWVLVDAGLVGTAHRIAARDFESRVPRDARIHAPATASRDGVVSVPPPPAPSPATWALIGGTVLAATLLLARREGRPAVPDRASNREPGAERSPNRQRRVGSAGL